MDLHSASRKLKGNDMNTATQTLYHRDGHEQTFTAAEISRMASCGQVGANRDWSSVAPPPPGWERTVPKYLVTRDVRPAERARYRHETPFASCSDSDVWQYGDREYAAGEIVETTNWPHASMQGLNYSGQQVLAFFKAEMKSRLPVSPWYRDQVRLSNGLSNAPGISDVKPPQLQPMNLRPVA